MAIPSIPNRGRRGRHSKPNAVPVPKNDYKTATLVDDDTSLAKSNRYVEGSNWRVDYYNQVKAENDLVSPLDISVTGDLQQYTKISNIELKVTVPLDVSIASDTEGQATVVNSVIPQDGDIFKATIAGNREALLIVTNTSQEYYNNNPLYKITYNIDSFLDQDDSRYRNIESKVVKEFIFDDDYTMTESAPVLLKSDFVFKKRLEKELVKLTHLYLRTCVSNKLKLLTIPGQTVEIGDPYLEDYIFKILNYSTSDVLTNVNRISSGVDLLSTDNIWMTLINKEFDSLQYVKKEFALIDTSSIEVTADIAKALINNDKSPTRLANVPPGTLPEFYPDDYTYLFTARFYDTPEDASLSLLEKLVYQLLTNNEYDTDWIGQLLDTVIHWTPVEKYYYIPVLLLIMKDSIRRTHSVL